MHELGRIPDIGDSLDLPGAQIKVNSMEGKRVGTLLLTTTKTITRS
jgi:CBS domain containing-hemolysin-like protein